MNKDFFHSVYGRNVVYIVLYLRICFVNKSLSAYLNALGRLII